MAKKLSITSLFNLYTVLIGTVLLLCMLSLFYMYSIMKELNLKVSNRYVSYQLADELRQSSDDLTRMARTFVITGDSRYEKAYFDILAIRNGEKRKPEKYNQIYWDLKIVGDDDERSEQDAVPLRKLMEEAGFTENEFAKLKEAQTNSDDLVKAETIAMNAIKEYKRSLLDSSIKPPVSKDSAIRMMHNLDYHLYKHKIMKPIDDFFDLLDERTLKQVVDYQRKNQIMIYFLVAIPIIIFVLLTLFYYTIKKRLIAPIVQLNEHSKMIAMGEFSKPIEVKYKDEIGNLSGAINDVAEGMKEKSQFVSEIGKANLNVNLKPLSDKDMMAYALLEMRENLFKISIEEKKRNWATEGLAKFGELLRESGSLQEVFDKVLSELIKYVKANQGSIFVVQEDGKENYLQLLSCFAWSQKRIREKKISKGEGLMGQAWLENTLVYLKEVPENYITITSGLGEALPKSILIVPLRNNSEILGMFELASFGEFDEHERDFLTNVAENMASVLSTLKTAEQTKKLLQQSQQRAEELRSQEEEMRQNMEELSTTQEELSRKEREYLKRIADLESKAKP